MKYSYDRRDYEFYYDGIIQTTRDYDDAIYRGTAENDKILFSSNRTTLYAGSGNDFIGDLFKNSNVVYGDAGDDTILAYCTNYPTIYGGKGNDVIQLKNSITKAYVDGGADDDTFIPLDSISGTTLIGGEGNDTFWFKDFSSVTVSGGNGKDVYRIDPYFKYNASTGRTESPHNDIVITDLSEEDIIRNDYEKANGSELDWHKENGNIVLKDDQDFFSMTLQGVTDIAQVADVVYQTAVWTGTLGELFNITVEPEPPKPAETVSLNSAKTAATILSTYTDENFNAADYGTGILSINGSAVDYDLTINGNAKNNRIIAGDGNDIIIGGKGNDCINGGNGDDIFVYNNGDGNDTIVDYSENDKIKVSSSFAQSVLNGASIKGNDVVFKIGSGKITVKNGADKIITFVDEKDNEYLYPDPDITVTLNSSGTAATILDNYDDEIFEADSWNSKIVTIDASAATVDLTIIGNKNKNKIIGGDGNDCIIGGKGVDTFTGGDGDDTFVYEYGTGNKVITDYTEGEDKIEIQGADVETVIKSATVSKGDVIFKVGSSKITVKGGDGQTILFTDEDGNEYEYPNSEPETVLFNNADLAKATSATITADYEEDIFDAADFAKLKTIDASEVTVEEFTINGNKLANKIIGSDGNDCINGGKGTDTLTGGDGDDTFVYEYGTGNKVITDYTEGEDKIEIQGADVETVIKSATVSKGDVIFKVGSGKITVKGGDGQTILFTDEDGNEYEYPNSESETVLFNNADPAKATSATITANYEEETFDATDFAKLKTIDGGAAENDLTILGNKLANKIIGGEGNDYINGGKGKDTLTGGEGDDTFVYEYGTGNKVITDYTEGEDKIEIQGANVEKVIKSATVSKGNVIFKVGSSKITVNGGADQEITFTDENGEEYYYSNPNAKTLDLLYDNNFVTDEFSLDSICEQKFTVTEIQTTNTENFAQDETLITFTDK